jgi:CheY-like chemotaxis protein
MESLGRIDVLVVEDDADALDGVLEVLRFEGLNAEGARDGEEALEMLKSGASPNLLLLDLTMPVMDGWEFCRRLEEPDVPPGVSDVPIAVFTGVEIDTVGDLPPRRHDAGFLQKPVDPKQLLDLARRYCLAYNAEM